MDKLWTSKSEKPSFVVVGGKGGVGKTTTSCAIAMRLAAEGKKTLLISTDPAHNAGDVLGVKLSGTIALISGSPNEKLYAVEIAPGEFFRLMLNAQEPKGFSLTGGSGDSSPPTQQYEAPLPLDFNQLPTHLQGVAKEAREWAESLPGVDESMMIARILKSLDGSEYDSVVFDTAPTGHTLRLLSLPAIIEKIVDRMQNWKVKLANYISMMGNMFSANPSGPNLITLSKRLQDAKALVEKLHNIFSDTKKTTFIPVMIPEALSVLETERMIQQLKYHRIPTSIIVVNQLLDPAFIDEAERGGKTVESQLAQKSKSFHNRDIKAEALALCASRAKMQQQHLSDIYRLFSEEHTIVEVPALPKEPKGQEGLLELSRFWHDEKINLRHPKYGHAVELESKTGEPSMEVRSSTTAKDSFVKTIELDASENSSKRMKI